MDEPCRSYLVERLQGEVYGERLFRALAACSEEAGHAHKWRVLERLETATKERIRTSLRSSGVEVIDDPESAARGTSDGERFARMPRDAFLDRFRAELAALVAKLAAAERLAPADTPERALLRAITDHERALLEFVERELGGRGKTSLEPALALLDPPRS
jgi:hypothetical protein